VCLVLFVSLCLCVSQCRSVEFDGSRGKGDVVLHACMEDLSP
jgi:hypothetical protein